MTILQEKAQQSPLSEGRRSIGGRRFRRRALEFLDPWLIFPATGLFTIGVLMIYSASRGTDPSSYDTTFLNRQLLYGLVGFILMVLAARTNFVRIYRAVPLIYSLGILALILVLTGLGSEHRESRAWFDVWDYQIQPSEFSKLALILALAAFIYRCRGNIYFPGLIFVMGLTALPALLIFFQPDVGTFLIYGVIALTMLIVGGLRSYLMLVLAGAAALGLFIVLNAGLLADFQERRLFTFINPSDGAATTYTQTQAQIAISNGGLTGQGYGNGVQTRGDFVPEQHTDFIFTVIGEELGFLGSIATIVLFGILFWRIWHISRSTSSLFEVLVLVGILAMLLSQAFQSMGMAMGIMPITGIPLPFVSYGGSSLLTSFLAIGMVMSIRVSSLRRSF